MNPTPSVSLTTVLDCHTSGELIEPDETTPTGHVLTIEHPGRNPQRDTLGDYMDIIHSALGEPDAFDDAYSITIESNQTVIRRDDVPVCTFGSKEELRSKATSPRLSHKQRRILEHAVEDMDATVAELATQADVHETVVRDTLGE